MINYLYIFMFIISLIYAILTNRVQEVTDAILQTPKEALFVFFNISAVLIFWSGILQITIESGMIKKLTKYVKKLIHPLFSVDINDEAMDYIALNFVANVIGVGSAATPFGLKAMKRLDILNDYSKTASKDMITLLVINASCLCLIPTTILALRAGAMSENSSLVLPYIIGVTIITTIFALTLNEVFKHGS